MVKASKFTGICNIILILCLVSFFSNGQRGNVWIFGDSARLEFNQPGASLRSNSWRSYASASISDTSGNLLFYSTATAINGFRESGVYSNLNQLLLNGNAIFNLGGSNSNIIIPYPGNDSLYYLFCQDYYPDAPAHPEGIYYNIINPTRGTAGEVLQKNILLKPKMINNVLTALQHGNGRDWWIYFSFDSLNSSGTAYVPNNIIYRVLVTPAGISPVFSQSIGTQTYRATALKFNKQGDKAAICSGIGLVEIYDIDRCTGLLTNPVTICLNSPNLPLMDIEFSANSRFLYTTSIDPGSMCLYQIDLQNGNPCQNRTALYCWSSPVYPGSIARWLDDKLYVAQIDESDIFDDTLHTNANSNIGVIEFPDNLGLSCQYNPFGYYLNGARVCNRLPNNPDYELSNWPNSICDTLATGLVENNRTLPSLNLYPNPASAFVHITTSEVLRGVSNLEIYASDGKLVISKSLPTNFTVTEIDISKLSSGIYLVIIRADEKLLVNKFTK
jgi:hypothetical protein